MRIMMLCVLLGMMGVDAGIFDTTGNMLETAGLVTFDTYGENKYARLDLELGVNPIPFLNAAVWSSWAYRNYSMTQTSGVSCGLRVPFKQVVVTIGPEVGVRSVFIGRYSNTDMTFGARAGISVPLAKRVALCLMENMTWVFDDHTAIATSTMIGISYGIVVR